ncbi:MAG: PQQ-dependent dehydrogenase, methanol/ethanol family, partial [Deltaproteobacteria bacterium]
MRGFNLLVSSCAMLLAIAAAPAARAAGVTDEDILNDASTPKDVVSYGMGPYAQRYSGLARI